jgi:hypothetical protein
LCSLKGEQLDAVQAALDARKAAAPPAPAEPQGPPAWTKGLGRKLQYPTAAEFVAVRKAHDAQQPLYTRTTATYAMPPAAVEERRAAPPPSATHQAAFKWPIAGAPPPIDARVAMMASPAMCPAHPASRLVVRKLGLEGQAALTAIAALNAAIGEGVRNLDRLKSIVPQKGVGLFSFLQGQNWCRARIGPGRHRDCSLGAG